MTIQENIQLSQYSTMRLGGTAAYFTEVTTAADIQQAAAWADAHNLPLRMIGGGSNIIWRDEGFAGLLVVNKIMGYDDTVQEDGSHLLTIGAGENWDSVVARSVAAGLSGIEALSLIPGTSGATPIQNVGAYGQEIADVLVHVQAYDMQKHELVTIPAEDCAFGYRSSRFKTTDQGRFLISSITLRLQQQNPQPPFYRAVTEYFAQHGSTEFTPASVRAAVIDIRSHKLPDPTVIANNGSFFANPIIAASQLAELLVQYADMPSWPAGDGPDGTALAKIPAAWLIEQAGYKDFHDTETGMATWHTQPLVLVNEAATSTADLLAFKQKIVSAVQAKFGITLEQEPELLPELQI